MNFKEYAELARRTLNNKGHKLNILHAITGIVTELGELADAYKRHIWYEEELDKVNVAEEVGDILWYIAVFATELNISHKIDFDLSEDMLPPAEGDIGKSSEHCLISILTLTNENSQFINSYDYAFNHSKAHLDSLSEFYESSELELKGFMTWFKGLCIDMSVDIEQSAIRNIEKLKKRFPEKFSEEAAINRDVNAERKVLEFNKPAVGLV